MTRRKTKSDPAAGPKLRSESGSSPENPSGSIDRLARHLPFAVDDFGSVNAHYATRTAAASEDRWRILDIWTYCFVRRYFTAKCLKDSMATSADLDQMIETAFLRVRRSRESLRTDRYANWVSVVCRNTYLNHRRSRKPTYSLDDPTTGLVAVAGDGILPGAVGVGERLAFRPDGIVAEPDAAEVERDSLAAVEAVANAIERLPGYLRDVARMKLLDGYTYEQISAELDRPPPILRAYFHRALLRLRKDRLLVEFFYGEAPPDARL